MVSQSQWLPPPSEGKAYDMDAVSDALHRLLMGWVEPQDPIFIPLRRCSPPPASRMTRSPPNSRSFTALSTAKSAYQHPVDSTSGLRRGTRIRIAPPRDSYERVHYDMRTNPQTGRAEYVPLGYLRYPNQKEVKRRKRLLRRRREAEENRGTNKRFREPKLHRLAAKRRKILGLDEGASPRPPSIPRLPSPSLIGLARSFVEPAQKPSPRTIKLESDVTWVEDGVKTLPIGQLVNPKGPSNLRESALPCSAFLEV